MVEQRFCKPSVVGSNPTTGSSLQIKDETHFSKVDADEDEDGVGGDDAADCLRYLVATKSRAIAQRKLRGV